MHTQAIVTAALIVAAALYLAWRWWPRRAAPNAAPDKCCGCTGCAPRQKSEHSDSSR